MASLFKVPEAKTPLGRHRILSTRSSVRVSPLCYGGMSLGNAWTEVMKGGLDEKQSHELLDAFWQKGGNFIDTANAYTRGESEQFIGSWMKARKNRSEMVIATKFTVPWKDQQAGANICTNFTGNSTKSLRHSLDSSLEKLQTDFVDLLYVHMFDYTTSIPEMMHSLHREVQRGRVDYLGVSDTPAWFVSAANEYANAHSLTPFVVYQGKWSAADRDFERDILPMCQHYGMALAPWGALGQGRFRTPEQVAQREKESGMSLRGGGQSEKEKKISMALDSVAQKVKRSIAQVALAYVMSKSPYVFPIIGGTKIPQMEDCIQALSLHLTPEHIKEIESAADFDLGFPLTMIGQDPGQGYQPSMFTQLGGELDWVQKQKSLQLSLPSSQ